MTDTRAEVERAYQAAVEVVERHELQHLAAYQLAGHIHRVRVAHLAELEAQTEKVREEQPDDDERAAHEAGRAAFRAGESRKAPGAHPRDRISRAWLAGWDEAKGMA